MARKFTNKEEVLEYLNTLPMQQLINVAADAILELNTKSLQKIVISKEQFDTFFRIAGVRENGTVETRGRKKIG